MGKLFSGEDRFMQIKDWLDKFENMNILEIGIGGGDISIYLSEKNNIYCVDIDKILINRFQEKINELNISSIKILIADAKELPFSSETFDLVILREVIEHVEEKSAKKILQNVYRVLKPNGHFLISTPNRFSPEGMISRTIMKLFHKEWNAWDPSHEKIYDFQEIKKMLITNNFKIEDIRGEYYFFNLIIFLHIHFPQTYPFLRWLLKTLDDKMGRNRYLSNFGFILEILCKKN